ncbi:cytochrome P450 [Chitinophaga lutea]
MHHPVIFRHSDVPDPFGHYLHMQERSPVLYDPEERLCVVYSYAHCRQALLHPSTAIPPVATGSLNTAANLLAGHLVRLRNGAEHAAARSVVSQLFRVFQPPDPISLLPQLDGSRPFDWMREVAGVLPALQWLAGYGFSRDRREDVLQFLPPLVQVMLPVKTERQIAEINEAADVLFPLAAAHIDSHPALAAIICACNGKERAAMHRLAVVNLLGLLIQSYDAGRGLSGNALLDRFAYGDRYNLETPEAVQAFVLESSRYHPAVHQTRRLALDTMVLGDVAIPAGTTLVLMLAAANRDPAQFENPEQFDPERANNKDQLSFGAGAHTCIAQHAAVQLTASILHGVFDRYPGIRLAERGVECEPLVNVRIPRSIIVSLT